MSRRVKPYSTAELKHIAKTGIHCRPPRYIYLFRQYAHGVLSIWQGDTISDGKRRATGGFPLEVTRFKAVGQTRAFNIPRFDIPR